MKKILGLDLGTNSIGWALLNTNENGKPCSIAGMGSRIIPMTQDVLDTFSGGKPLETQTSARTGYRGVRRIRERHLLRRERLHRVLNVLGFLPEHYANHIDFNKHYGKFVDESEPKLTYNNRQFIFAESFEEMLNDFKQLQPQLFYTKSNGKETKIPYDWTIYYLRKKALSHKIAKEELAWIILNFNQKRGYYQLRGEEEERTDVNEFCALLKIISVEKGEKDKKNDRKTWYKISFENGWEYSATFTSEPKWLNTEKEFLITEEFEEDGSIKIVKDKKSDTNGKEKRRITPLPSFDEINLMSKKEQDKIYKKIKARTEITIRNSNKTVGSYIYESLLQTPAQKIRGKLVRTIERKFYKEELVAILKKQIEIQPELFTEELYNDCVRELYRSNETQQLVLSKRDFVHLLVEDIIFYQRPLRSQKSSIGNCTMEYRIYKDKDSNQIKEYLKAIPKSHPLYQEFRVWQWLYNLKIYRKEDDKDVTAEFLKDANALVALFEFLMLQKEIGHKDVLKHLISPTLKEKYPNAKATAFNKEVDKEIAKYRWNYVFDDSKEKEEEKSKKYPCNTTGYEIRRRLEKVENIQTDFLTPQVEQHLWHIIYSVTDKYEYKSALGKFARRYSIDENSFVANFEKFHPFPSEYGAYSEKAIKKFLPLMRIGKYWNWDAIDSKTQERIGKIISGEYDDNIKTRVREKAISLTDNNHFQGLPIWLASYIIYDRHAEADIAGKWNFIEDLEQYLKDFKQHSLRNPIVEQIVTETLRVVRDIWKQYGQGAKDFFSEIHVELGREMKNTADDRKWMTEQMGNNEATNLRIKSLLMELKENTDGKLPVENVRPYSPMQQDALRIYEDGVLNSKVNLPEDIVKISKTAQPSKAELQRYKLWLEQKYRSPYTGEVIPLGRLFSEDYQIEHVIPKSRYFDDSFNNKVICESAVNQLKDKQLGLEFIKNYHGEKVECGMWKVVEIFTEEAYQTFVKENYTKNKAKRQNLLLEDIPEKMIARQMNDTRYISKFISSLLSNIVRADKEDDGINSKNLIPGNGKITTALKKDWGMDAVWNDLILPRFERMNQLTNSDAFTYWNEQYQKFMPVDYSPADWKRIEKKRIDHRHHAMDALVIACMTRDHVNLLNNQSAKSETSRYDLQNKLRNKSKESWFDKRANKQIERDVFKEFKKPWDNFTLDAKNALETIVVSFKQNLRVINKATNNYQKWVEKNGVKVKGIVKQEGTNWAIRKPMHKETVSGKVVLSRIKVPKGKILTATRKSIDTTFDLKTIDSITDTGIQKILRNFLAYKGNNPELAFSPEGLEEMNANIKQYNDGKSHKPIRKVRIFELGSKFSLGERGNKKYKYVEAAKGTNLFFAIYINEAGIRSFETIPLNIAIEQLKQGKSPVTEIKFDEKMNKFTLQTYLSPNDLVYVPYQDQRTQSSITVIDKSRIYKFIDSSDSTANFIPATSASTIFNLNKKDQEKKGLNFGMQNEFGIGSPQSKNQKALSGEMIKDVCIKLKVDRLGNILF